MSTGNNKDETIVTKKRKRVLPGYIHPNKAEIKRFDFFTGDAATSGESRTSYSQEFLTTFQPVNPEIDQHGCWELVKMENPDEGITSYQRIGMKYFLKYIKFKGHISICHNIPFTIRYKLILIKTDRTFATASDFFMRSYSNFQMFNSTVGTFSAVETFCRHNFYKTYKYALGMAEDRTSVLTVSSGTLSPVDYIPKPTKTSTLGSNPSYSYTEPDLLRFGATEGLSLNQMCYLPLNVSVQVNDNVEVGKTHFYLMLLTDHGIGVAYPTYSQSVQYLYRANANAGNTCARFNFLGICYFTDL